MINNLDFEDILKFGMKKVEIPDIEPVNKIRDDLAVFAANLLKITPGNSAMFLDQYHIHFEDNSRLNDHRMQIIEFINSVPGYKQNIYQAFKPIMDVLIGCDVAIQRRINLVIQIPNYPEENLQIHSDVEGGNSPFEITIWLPLNRVYGTKTMFILDRTIAESVEEAMEKYRAESLNDLCAKLVRDENYLTMEYGEALLFNPFLLHGNNINTTSETRWAINVRMKSLFSPYGCKDFGEYFEPIKISPLTRLGLEYYKTHKL